MAAVSGWVEREVIVPPEEPGAIAEVSRVRCLLISAAHHSEALSYRTSSPG